ncbi:MAG: thiopeptide-type bacteriocin biosynthesis protein [Alphaproteobacteria bacterium]|nr:thiopeptide-type bacteriocin biosynthesis protein [Alphaproteobacteria bacterium]
MGSWLSFHIYYTDHDLILTECIASFVRDFLAADSQRSFFFIRYWDRGPHVRLRLLVPDQQRREQIVVATIAELRAFMHVNPSTPPRLPTLGGVGSTLEENNSVIRARYEPEYFRYGGAAAMSIAEDVFRGSSEIALSAISSLRSQPLQRISLILTLIAVTAQIFCQEEEMFVSYFGSYRRAVEESIRVDRAGKDVAQELYVADQARLGVQIPALLDRAWQWSTEGPAVSNAAASVWARLLRRAKVALAGLELERPRDHLPAVDEVPVLMRPLWSIAISQSHMMANRLGAPILTEARLVALLHTYFVAASAKAHLGSRATT